MSRTPRPPETSPSPIKPASLGSWRAAETKTILDELSSSLRRSLADHQVMLDVLLERRAELPLELGELFEDASNAYMEMSESVSQNFLTARGSLLE